MLLVMLCCRQYPSYGCALKLASLSSRLNSSPSNNNINRWRILSRTIDTSLSLESKRMNTSISNSRSSSNNNGSSSNDNNNTKNNRSYTCSVEWSPKMTLATSTTSSTSSSQQPQHNELLSLVDNFILPDLPMKYSEEDRNTYFNTIPYNKQCITIATCHYKTKESLIDRVSMSLVGSTSSIINDDKENKEKRSKRKLLLVSGNDKDNNTNEAALSSIDAARILHSSSTKEQFDVYGVINPNDPNSIKHVENKIEYGGITKFITQPLLTKDSIDIFNAYPLWTTGDASSEIEYIVGIAMPQNIQNLYFWLKLLDIPQQPEKTLLQNDPLFQQHVNYFASRSSSDLENNTKLIMTEWIQNEICRIEEEAASINDCDHGRGSRIHGFHFMPVTNIQKKLNPLIEILNELKQHHHQ